MDRNCKAAAVTAAIAVALAVEVAAAIAIIIAVAIAVMAILGHLGAILELFRPNLYCLDTSGGHFGQDEVSLRTDWMLTSD